MMQTRWMRFGPSFVLALLTACHACGWVATAAWGEDLFDGPPLFSAEISRANRGEIYGIVQGWLASDGNRTEFDTSTDLKPTALVGLGFGYHLTDHINTHIDLLLGLINMETGLPLLPSQSGTAVSLMGHVDYNLFKTRLTPLATAGVGLMHVDGDSRQLLDMSQTNVVYSLGGGLRWDVTDTIFIKAVYESLWTRMKALRDQQRIDTLGLYLGITF